MKSHFCSDAVCDDENELETSEQSRSSIVGVVTSRIVLPINKLNRMSRFTFFIMFVLPRNAFLFLKRLHVLNLYRMA